MPDTEWKTYEKRGVSNTPDERQRCEREAYLALVQEFQAPVQPIYTWSASEIVGKVDLTVRGRALTMDEIHARIRKASNDH